MDKVLIIGCSGGGKSTVARELGKLLDIEVTHLDQVLWKPGCQLTEKDEEPDEVARLLDRPRWIMDGNYTVSLPMRLAEADTVVFVDYDRKVCFWRAIKRLLKYRGKTRPDMGAQCPEQLNFSFLKWIWNYPNQERPKLLEYLHKHGSHANVVRLCSPEETEKWLERLKATAGQLKPPDTADSMARVA